MVYLTMAAQLSTYTICSSAHALFERKITPGCVECRLSVQFYDVSAWLWRIKKTFQHCPLAMKHTIWNIGFSKSISFGTNKMCLTCTARYF